MEDMGLLITCHIVDGGTNDDAIESAVHFIDGLSLR